ncbi:MAG: hypothetical protein V1755_13815, partial [Chloroflexota bacterium]
VECNGGRWKAGGGRHMSEADFEKMRRAAATGWVVLPVSPQQLARDPWAFIGDLRDALAFARARRQRTGPFCL